MQENSAQINNTLYDSDNCNRNFVWQLFTEGIAMYFEQALVGNFNYYHQDKNGCLEWCDNL